MYGLSIYPPWSELIVLDEKRYETRSFSVKHRGPLLIHASKRDMDLKHILATNTIYRRALGHHGFTQLSDFTLGAALGIVDLVDCSPTEMVREALTAEQDEQELAFGNFQPHRFAWRLENVRRFEVPIPMKGMQGLFNVDPLLLPAIREQMIIWHEMHGAGVKECGECHHVAAADKDIVHAKKCSKAEQKETAQ